MKFRLSLVALLLTACLAEAQTTPNLGLNIPPPGTLDWGTLINQNFQLIDTWSTTVCTATGCTMTGPLIAPSSLIGTVVQLPGGVQPAGTLQAAVTTAGANTTIALPNNYSETIISPISIASNNVTIRCELGASIVSSGAAQIFTLAGTSDWVTSCNLSGATQQAIYITGSAAYVSRNNIANGGNLVPGAGSNAGIEMESNGAIDTWIVGNTITGGGNAAAVNTGADILVNYTSNQTNNGINRLHINGNHIFGNNSPFSVMLFNVSDTEVTGNIIDQNNKIGSSNTASGYGILIYNTVAATGPCTRNIVERNNVSNTAGSAIYLQGSTYSVIEANVLTNVVLQQLDTVLTVAAIAVNAGNPSSASAPGVVVNGNTIHTSQKQGIAWSYAPGIVVSNNVMDGVVKFGIFAESGPTNNQPTISANFVSAATTGIVVQGITGAIITSNSTTGFANQGIFTDTTSPNATVANNIVTGNTADASGMWVQGNGSNITGNTFYGLTTKTTGETALRVTGSNSHIRANNFNNTAISIEILITSGTTALIVEGNTITHTSGTSFAIVEQAGASADVYHLNVINGGTASGLSLSGTTPLSYENSFNGVFSAIQATSVKIGNNTVLPATLTGIHGTDVNLQTSDGTGTSQRFAMWDVNGGLTNYALPTTSPIQTLTSCGNSSTCSSAGMSSPKCVVGSAPLAGGTVTVTGIPAFTSALTYFCVSNDASTVAATRCVNTSSSSITITGTGTDTVGYILCGN